MGDVVVVVVGPSVLVVGDVISPSDKANSSKVVSIITCDSELLLDGVVDGLTITVDGSVDNMSLSVVVSIVTKGVEVVRRNWLSSSVDSVSSIVVVLSSVGSVMSVMGSVVDGM